MHITQRVQSLVYRAQMTLTHILRCTVHDAHNQQSCRALPFVNDKRLTQADQRLKSFQILKLMNLTKHILASLLLAIAPLCAVCSQELNATVEINTSRLDGTNKTVFENLKQAMTDFLNERHWTNQQYNANERIKCGFTIIVTKYNSESGLAACEAYISSQRPIYGSTYNTTVFSKKDKEFYFNYREFDQLEFNIDNIDNSLTALLAYYAYLIIGIDMDTMAPLGGTEMLEKAMTIVNNSQGLNVKGWKAFDDASNRFGILNDYLEEKFVPFRQLQYKYHREGLDRMTENPDLARNAITECFTLLKEARQNKPLSAWPMMFSEYKRDELVGIYRGQENESNKMPLYDFLTKLNASQTAYWKQMLK